MLNALIAFPFKYVPETLSSANTEQYLFFESLYDTFYSELVNTFYTVYSLFCQHNIFA